MGKNREGPQGCLLYTQSLKMLSYLNDDQAGRVIKAAVGYFLTGELPELEDQAERMVCESLRDNVDRSLERYREICDRNRRNRNRSRLAAGEYYVLPDGEPD